MGHRLSVIVLFTLFYAHLHGLSQRCVVIGYALRVSPAVTRLTVYYLWYVWLEWVSASCSTSSPGNNLVDDLPPAATS